MKVYETRWDFIEEHVKDREVLDVGPAELVGTVRGEKLDRWIHGKIARVSKRLVGLDQNKEQIEILRRMGYDIKEGDAENFNLGEAFEVILGGELIEHLSNPGKFLACARNHLLEKGRLLLTTPNRYSILSVYFAVRTGKVPAYQKPITKHVVYFDEDALSSLLNRYGFEDVQLGYCKWAGAVNTRRQVRLAIDIVGRYRPVFLPVLVAMARKGD